MKKIITVVVLLITGLTYAQNIKPKFEVENGLVKATYFYENGCVRQQGYFKNKKLTGTWVSFDEQGYKTAVAVYKEGKKDGKWLVSVKEGLKELTFKNNKIYNVSSSNVALN